MLSSSVSLEGCLFLCPRASFTKDVTHQPALVVTAYIWTWLITAIRRLFGCGWNLTANLYRDKWVRLGIYWYKVDLLIDLQSVLSLWVLCVIPTRRHCFSRGWWAFTGPGPLEQLGWMTIHLSSKILRNAQYSEGTLAPFSQDLLEGLVLKENLETNYKYML